MSLFGMRARRLLATTIVVWACVSLCLAAARSSAGAAALPDNRGFELVSSISGESGGDVLNGAAPLFYDAAVDGNAVDWQSLGACCGATYGGLNVYQSERGAAGWATHVIGPTPSEPAVGLLELQEAIFASGDLGETIFTTPASYAQGDRRPPGAGGSDLYLREPNGALDWLSQGPAGTGTGPDAASFEGATPNATAVAFTTAEPLTTNATGLSSQAGAQYLYVRNVAAATTSLIDVDDSGNPISPYGASLGDYGAPKQGLFFFGYRGSTINAISATGMKVFFETPPDGATLPAGVAPHLYMRDLADGTTMPIDDPTASGSARYQGASANGALVFFTSDEGLDGASTANELYEYNTTAEPLDGVPSMTSIPLASGAGIVGVTSVSEDGSHVYFVADDVLAANTNFVGRPAMPNQPNLYVRNTSTGTTTFVTTLAPPDVTTCKPTCMSFEATELVLPHDIFRPAYSSPDGSVLVFKSSNDLTGEDRTPSTTLTAAVFPKEHKLHVESTAGFIVGRTVAIGTGEQEELETVEAINGATEMTLSEYGPAIVDGFVNEHPAEASVSAVNAEVYRYATAGGSLVCLSCTPPGVTETYSASLGEVAGGSYAPPGHVAQMSEAGSRIFFQSPDPLLPGMAGAVTNAVFPPENVYEWEEGKVHLISTAAEHGSVFDGTTPSGDDAFFSTRSQLTPQAVPGFEHIYDARVGGGFATQEPLADPCAREACRTLAGPPSQYTVPASEHAGDDLEAQAHLSGSSFSVARITAAQRQAFAHSGRLALTVSTTAAGTLLASATGPLHGRVTRIAQAAASLRAASTVTLTLRLSRAARAQLAAGDKLAIRIAVSFNSRGVARTLAQTLHVAANDRAAARRRSRHA